MTKPNIYAALGEDSEDDSSPDQIQRTESDDAEVVSSADSSYVEFAATDERGGFPVTVQEIETTGSGSPTGQKEKQWDPSRDIKPGSVSSLAAAMFGASAAPHSNSESSGAPSSTGRGDSGGWSQASAPLSTPSFEKKAGLETVYEGDGMVTDDSAKSSPKPSAEVARTAAAVSPRNIPGSVSVTSDHAMSDLDVSTVTDAEADGKIKTTPEKKRVIVAPSGNDEDSAIALLSATASTTPSPQAAGYPFQDDDEPDDLKAQMRQEQQTRALDLVLGQFDIADGDPLHYSETETLLSAYDHSASPPMPVVIKLMTDASQVTAELDSRSVLGLDQNYVVPIIKLLVDEGDQYFSYSGPIAVEKKAGLTLEMTSCLEKRVSEATGCELSKDTFPPYRFALVLEHHNRTLEDVLAHDRLDLQLVRKIIKDVVVGLILLHTERRVHCDIKPRSIVRVGTSWKLADFQTSCEIGTQFDTSKSHMGYCPPEVASTLTSDGLQSSYEANTAYDLWSLGCIIYHLVFGMSLWNIDQEQRISEIELVKLAKWSPQVFLKKAAASFPSAERSEDQKAIIDLISKLLTATPNERNANFEYGIISVHQHEFVSDKKLERDVLDAFEEKQNMMFKSEAASKRFFDILKGLTLEEQWDLRRSRDVLLLGLYEPTEKHIPTTFVILKEKLPPTSSDEMSLGDAKGRLAEGMKWVYSFEKLGPSVKAALEGDVSAIGHFWGKIGGMFKGDYMYLYFIDELTGEPVRGDGTSKDYPIEVRTFSDVVPKLLPLMQLSMRSMALYNGAAGIARMFGYPLESLPEDLRKRAQEKVNFLKDESSASPFGVISDEIDDLMRYKEQHLKGDTMRCKSLRELIRLVEKKFGHDADFVGLNRYPDGNGRAIWTMLADAKDVKVAVKKRADERLKEERNQWVDIRDSEIDTLQKSLNEEKVKVEGLEVSLSSTRGELEASNHNLNELEIKSKSFESGLKRTKQQLGQVTQELEEEKKKCCKCVIQ